MRVIAGPEKKTRLLSEKERLITAYHEMGHALVGHFLPNCDPVHKISVVSRGQALGYTISMPSEDKFLTTKAALMDTLAMTLGGRAAEELVFDEVTTGAANDIEKVTASSKNMVMRWGMSEKLGPRALGGRHDQPFLGREFGHEADYSQEIAREIDDEIRRIIEEAHDSARQVLAAHVEDLHRLSKILLEVETIDRDQFLRLLDGEAEETVFPPAAVPTTPEPSDAGERREAKPRGLGLPLPGTPDTPGAGAYSPAHRTRQDASRARSARRPAARPTHGILEATPPFPATRLPAEGRPDNARSGRVDRVYRSLQRMLEAFTAHLPVEITFGDGCVSSLPGVLARHGVSRPFIVIEEPVADHPGIAAALAAVPAGRRFVKPSGEPTMVMFEDCVEAFSASGTDGIIAIGGGSAIDLSRATRAVVGYDSTCEDVLAGRVEARPPHVPLISVPTTSGTGADLTGAFVIKTATVASARGATACCAGRPRWSIRS